MGLCAAGAYVKHLPNTTSCAITCGIHLPTNFFATLSTLVKFATLESIPFPCRRYLRQHTSAGMSTQHSPVGSIVEDGAAIKDPPFPTVNAATGLGVLPCLRVRDLYRPVLVTIIVDVPAREFHVPRALICGRSAYFEKAFSERFKEGHNRVLRLPVVKCDTFEVFVGWLYTQRILHDPTHYGKDTAEKADAYSHLEAGQTTLQAWLLRTSPAQGDGKRKRTDVEAPEDSDGEVTEQKRVRLAHGFTAVRRSVEPSGETAQVDGRASQSQNPRDEHYQKQPKEQGGKLLPQKEGENKDDRGKPDLDDPITWDWEWLFELYDIGDAYDTRLFRTAVIEIIQIKALQRKPRDYFMPHLEDLCYVFEQMPPTSPLYKFMIDILTYYLDPSNGTVVDWQVLPPEALAATWLKTKQLESFRNCSTCQSRPSSLYLQCDCAVKGQCRLCRPCRSWGHPDIQTGRPPYFQDMCQYHEHETAEEKALCSKRWDIIVRERDI